MQRSFLAVISLAGVLLAQAPPSTKEAAPPIHQSQLRLSGKDALRHLREGNARTRLAIAQGTPVPEPAERPAGAGRYVAAVVVCADAGLDPASLFSLWPKDVLVIATPGARLGAEEVALLERTVQQEHLSLVVVLGHAGCASLLPAAKEATPAQQQLSRRGEPARELAGRRHFPVDKAQALLQVEAVLASSELLKKAMADDSCRVVPASVVPKTGEIVWHLTRADEMEPGPIK